MEKNTINFDQAVVKIIEKILDNGAELSKTWGELKIDSIDVVDIIMKCEKEFNIQISDDEMLDIMDERKQAQKLVDFIEAKVS